MKGKIIFPMIFVLLIAFVLGVSGTAEMVNEKKEDSAGRDRLIGVFVTTEHLDLFDSETWFNDNVNKIISGKDTRMGDQSQYYGRLYAELVDRELVNENTGELTYLKEYVFEGVQGFMYCVPTVSDDYGEYISSTSDDAITDGHMNYATTDEGESITLTGTIYVSTGTVNRYFYFNPVYQAEDGTVYAVTGNGMNHGGDLVDGVGSSIELKENTATIVNGKSVSYSFSVKLDVSFVQPSERIAIVQMSDDNKVLSREEYEPGGVPADIVPVEGAGYVIVETYQRESDGSLKIIREIYQPDDDFLYTFYVREDGVCVKGSSSIRWG